MLPYAFFVNMEGKMQAWSPAAPGAVGLSWKEAMLSTPDVITHLSR